MCRTLCLCIWYSVDFFQQPWEGMFFYFPHLIDDATRYREVISTSNHRTEINGGSGMEARMSSGILSPELKFSSVQSLSCVWLFATPWTAASQASLAIANSWSLLKLIELVMPSSHLISVIPFSSYLQSFPAWEKVLNFLMTHKSSSSCIDCSFLETENTELHTVVDTGFKLNPIWNCRFNKFQYWGGIHLLVNW